VRAADDLVDRGGVTGPGPPDVRQQGADRVGAGRGARVGGMSEASERDGITASDLPPASSQPSDLYSGIVAG
jgi:hypothetical protein